MKTVSCIRCEGKTVSPETGQTCQVCDGAGSITEKRRDILLRIRHDLTKRMRERGMRSVLDSWS